MRIQVTRRDGSAHTILFDDADAELLLRHRWHVFQRTSDLFYACTNIRRSDGRRSSTYMHNLLLGLDPDHVNHDGLDNRRENLRVATRGQQGANRHVVVGESRFKGVSRLPGSSRWMARIRVDRVSHYLGSYLTQQEAACAYDEAALFAWGTYALLNFPVPTGEAGDGQPQDLSDPLARAEVGR